MATKPELTVWINGEWVKESEARISVFDLGFLRGDAVFDAARTFGGRIFQAAEHVERLLASCRSLELDPGLSQAELVQIGESVAQANAPLVPIHQDFWVMFHVTRGIRRKGFAERSQVIVLCTPLPLAERAVLYRDGIAVVIPSVRRTPPWAVSPRIKSHNYLNFVVAELDTKRLAPGAWPLLLDENGCLAEGYGSNVFVVKDGGILTPFERNVLPGISRAMVLKLASELGMAAREADLEPHDLRSAEEVFFTSTSLCLCPVSSVNGFRLPGSFPGPITQRLQQAYQRLAGFDFVGQYLAQLESRS